MGPKACGLRPMGPRSPQLRQDLALLLKEKRAGVQGPGQRTKSCTPQLRPGAVKSISKKRNIKIKHEGLGY